MRKRVLSVLALVAVVLNLFPATAGASGNGIAAKATGSGHFTTGGQLRTFSFSAVRDTSGAVRGEAELDNRALNLRFHMTLNCLNIAGNVATMSGVVSGPNGGLPEGTFVWFTVADNGEGAHAAPDLISLVYFTSGPPGLPCSTQFVPPTIVIAEGNIQVH